MASTRRSVLITGCSAGGIGAALADEFHRKGYHVFATARTPSKISKSLAEAPNVTILTLDVLSSESIGAAAKIVSTETRGRLDVLVNNSGSGIILPALDTPIEAGKELFDLNFWAVLAMIQAFAPLLVKAKGCIVNNASVAGVLPFVYQSLYGASKGALIIASETWRLELAPLGIRTLTIMTPGVKTSFLGNLKPMTLPENSYYSVISDFIKSLADGKRQEDAMSSEEYAIKVVRELERGTTGKFWPGRMAITVRLVSWLLPQVLIDKMLEKMWPVSDKVAKDLKNRNNGKSDMPKERVIEERTVQ